ncbi:SMP-30/gluconolactonase/LRE family protein [Variovorax sp. LjRoot290]|uniref:SMP-30/gluconolactonase/LRE family protein n=1 Tax=Variovorax sp. LjRoot290 TaxID=3342316 RepID=UPI003ED09A7B
MRAPVNIEDLSWLGEGLSRPECVLATAKGELFCADHAHGVVQVGREKQPLKGVPEGFLPNGVAMLRDRSFLIANMAPEAGGGVWSVGPDRVLKPWLMGAEGQALPHANFVLLDGSERIWITVSTRRQPRQVAYARDGGDGFLVMVNGKGARIVADGLGFTNECRLDPAGRWLYVVETFARCLSRFPVRDTGLGPREVVHEFSNGDFPDGLAFDEEGAAWVACVVSNRLIRVTPEGRASKVLDGSDAGIVETVERSFFHDRLGRHELELGMRSVLGNLSSITFAGPDLRDVVLGSLGNARLACFRASVPGAAPAHWHF